MKRRSGPIKILFIAPQPFFVWRGSPIRVGFAVQALAENGAEVALLTLPVGEDRSINGVRVLRVANIFGVKNVPIGPSIAKLWFDLLLLFKGLRLAFQNGYDVIHGVEDAGVIALMIGKLTGAKVVFEKHSDSASYKASGAMKRLLLGLYTSVERTVVKRVDRIVCTGPGLTEIVKAMSPRGEAVTIYDVPSSLAEPNQEKADKLRSKGKTVCCFVGSFASYQGIDLLMESIAIASKKESRLEFWIIGGTKEEISEKLEYLKNAGVEADACKFIGKVSPDELPTYLAACDIMLSPRVSGVNTPLKLFDYMKVGKPIVATDNDANRLILDDTVAKFVSVEAPAFAGAIVDLSRAPDSMRDMGGKALALIRDKYGYESFKSRLGTLYAGLTERRGEDADS